MLSVSIAYFIHMTGIPLAFSFLIVFVLYLLIAGLLGVHRARKVKQVRRPGAGDPPGTGDEDHHQAWLTTPAASVEDVEIPGPWQHRYVAANGARFHVAEAGPLTAGW